MGCEGSPAAAADPGSVGKMTVDVAGAKEWVKVEMTDLLARRAGKAETLVQEAKVQEAKKKQPPAPAPEGERSAASIKRARKKLEARMGVAPAAAYVATGMAGSSNGLRPSTPISSVAASDDEGEAEDDDAKEERELLSRMQALKLKKAAAAKAAAEAKEGIIIQDGAAGAAAGDVKVADLYQFVCVGSAT